MSDKVEVRAYVVQRGTHDYTPLLNHVDKIVYLSSGMLSQFRTGKLYRQLKAALSDSRPTDYLVPTGLGVTQMIAAAIFAKKHGRLNLLLFNNGRYVKREIILREE